MIRYLRSVLVHPSPYTTLPYHQTRILVHDAPWSEANTTKLHVLTGVAIIDRATGQHLCACEDTTVEMRTLSESDILGYVDSGEADGKAGAYAIQESGDRFVHNVNGSLSNVIGLPMELLRKMLNEIDT